jgi:hypothetical protein
VEAAGRCTGLVQLGGIVGTHPMVWNIWTTDSWSLYVRYGLNVRDIAQASSLGRTCPAEMRERAVRMVREGEAAFGSEGTWSGPSLIYWAQRRQCVGECAGRNSN